ncbi:hypothetical protein GCM10023259_061000 [Thermocatellispora tengchongensis]
MAGAPGRLGSRRRVWGLAAAVAGVAAAATVAFTVSGGLAGAAYAVTKGADGSVEVEIKEFRDPEALEADLKAAGVNAVVDYLPAGKTCKGPRGNGAATRGEFRVSMGNRDGGMFFRIEKGQVAKDQTLVLAVSVGDADSPPAGTTLEIVEGAVAPCEPVDMPIPPDGKTDREPGGFVEKYKDGTGRDEGPSHSENFREDDGGVNGPAS